MAFISPALNTIYSTSNLIAIPIAVPQPINPTLTAIPTIPSIVGGNPSDLKKVVNPFDPEAAVPLPFQLDDNFGPLSGSVWKRNERERYRVRCVNEGYEKLRIRLPLADGERRISKVDTLRLAIRYIRHLEASLKNDQHIFKCRCFHGFKEESEGNVQVDISTRHKPY